MCENYVSHHEVDDIIVDGMRADHYAEHVMQSYEKDREVQKANKVT